MNIKTCDLPFYNMMKDLGINDNDFSYIEDEDGSTIAVHQNILEKLPLDNLEPEKQQKVMTMLAACNIYEN